MDLIPVLLFGLSANADSFVIGVAYGLRKIRIPFFVNTLIGMVTALGTMLSIVLGRQIGAWIPAGSAHFLGSGFLVLLGLYYLINYYRKKEPAQQQSADYLLAEPVSIPLKEAVSVSVALSFNNAGMGVGASIGGIPVILTSLFSFIFSVLLLFLGNYLGTHRLPYSFSRFAQPLSGLVIIVLGIYEFLV